MMNTTACTWLLINICLSLPRRTDKMDKIPYAERVRLLAQKFALDDLDEHSQNKIQAGNTSTTLNEYFTLRIRYNEGKARIAVAEMADAVREAYMAGTTFYAHDLQDYLKEQGL